MSKISAPWIENSPIAPEVQVLDLVDITVGTRRLTGYVIEKGPGWMRMWNGPTFPDSAIARFVQRNGAEFLRGTQALPIDHF